MNKAKASSIKPDAVESGAVRLLLPTGATALVSGQDSSTHVTQSTSEQYPPPETTRPACAGTDERAISKTTTTSSLLTIVQIRTFQSDSIADQGDPNAFYQKSTLLKLAEIAYSRRDLAALEQISAQLLSTPDRQSQSAGRYYSAIAAKRRGDERRAISLLESIRHNPRAIQALGTIEFEAGRYESALPLFIQAAQAAKGYDLATGLSAMNQVSFIKSIAGDHRQAFDDLLALWPIVRSVHKTHPHLYFNWFNDCAVELLELGRIEEAKASLSVALCSPISTNYHEYQDTRESIERCERKRIIVTVRRLKKTVLAFRFCFIAKRVILSTVKPRVLTPARTITERVTVAARTHAPPVPFRKQAA